MIKVLRLRELTKTQVKKLGELMRRVIHSDKSHWVCQQRQQPQFWKDDHLLAIWRGERGHAVRAWIGIVSGRPKGLCWVNDGSPDRTIALFLVDEELPLHQQLEVADKIALSSIEDMLADDCPGKRNFISYFPDNTPAARYAKLCRFRMESMGTTIIPVERPIMRWEIGMKELRDNILARQ